MMTQRFQGKTVLILGGNSGIGLAAAKAFRDEGGKVAVTGRDEKTLQSARDELGIQAFRADITDIAQTKAAIDQAAAALGKFDVFFVNAGAPSVGRLAKITPEDWDYCHNVNLRGCIFAIQAADPHMAEGGAIVMSGSVASRTAIVPNLAYATAKAGLSAATRVLAADFLSRKIRVNTVSFGPTRTELYKRGADAEKIAKIEERLAAGNPMGRMADAEEAVRAVLFLASNEASYITGADLAVDGGHVELSAR
jgi:NAD(P)-dependent dehydrogenase (short-subunit alcohol dehydrogenase family)